METYLGKVCTRNPEHGSVRRAVKGDCLGCRREAQRAYRKAKTAVVAEQKHRARKRKTGLKGLKPLTRYTKYAGISRAWKAMERAKRFGHLYSIADKEEFLSIYDEAVKQEVATKIKLHVDHIIPLKGDNVSGLHVPWNLQIIPARDNCKKGNRL